MARRALPISCLLVALALGAYTRGEAIDSGFLSDDYVQRAMLHDAYPQRRAPYDLFHFAGGGERETRALTGYGYYPWWTHTDFRLSMLRPLASLSHALDYALFGDDARAHHLVSFLWWALCVSAVSGLLFRLLPPAAAGVATILFALDESHGVPTLWIANRSLLMATAFGVAALYAHLRHRASRARGWRLASVGLFAVALGCGEYALPLLGYLVCLELRDPSPGTSRGRALAPFVALGAAFVVAGAALGYGAAHSGLYTSPLGDPAGYARKLGAGLPVLFGDLLLGNPADSYTFGPINPDEAIDAEQLARARGEQVALGVLGMALAGLTWLGVRRRLSGEHARALDWLALGVPVAMLPVLGSFISTRLVLPASLGGAALLGCALTVAAGALLDAWRRRLRGFSYAELFALVVALAVIGYVPYLHGYRAASRGRDMIEFYTFVARARTHVPFTAEIDDTRIARQHVIVVAAADANDAPYLPFVRLAHGSPLPGAFRLLSGSPGAHELHRIDARTLELYVLAGPWPRDGVVGSLTRGQEDFLDVGQRFELPGLRVEILGLQGRQPQHLRYTFDVPLEDPSLLWLEPTQHGLKRLALPKPGEMRVVAPPVLSELVTAAAEASSREIPQHP